MKYAAVVALWIASAVAHAQDIQCKVVGISDGDTFTCLSAERKQVKVRMAEIDTPESKQPYGNKAKQALSSLIFGKDVTLHVQDVDRYGRTVATVQVGNVDVNAEMVRTGAAWAYRDFLKDQTLLNLEATAKHFKRGIWSLPKAEQQAPWDWRKNQRNGKQTQQQTASLPSSSTRSTSQAGGFSCSTLKSCGQMSGCAEARYQLRQCGNPRIDGDGDGIPCEAICR